VTNTTETSSNVNRSEYRQQLFQKVYDREVTARTGMILRTDHIYIEDAADEEGTVRVDDISDGQVHLTTLMESGHLWANFGTDLTPGQARELASALYEAANVAETWEEP
jgi:hypothetical protein